MNPELEELIQAYDALTLAPNEQTPALWQTFDKVLDSTLARNPRLQREQLVE
jgi:hypothetical protein